jgi:hypothetical protein
MQDSGNENWNTENELRIDKEPNSDEQLGKTGGGGGGQLQHCNARCVESETVQRINTLTYARCRSCQPSRTEGSRMKEGQRMVNRLLSQPSAESVYKLLYGSGD